MLEILSKFFMVIGVAALILQPHEQFWLLSSQLGGPKTGISGP